MRTNKTPNRDLRGLSWHTFQNAFNCTMPVVSWENTLKKKGKLSVKQASSAVLRESFSRISHLNFSRMWEFSGPLFVTLLNKTCTAAPFSSCIDCILPGSVLLPYVPHKNRCLFIWAPWRPVDTHPGEAATMRRRRTTLSLLQIDCCTGGVRRRPKE